MELNTVHLKCYLRLNILYKIFHSECDLQALILRVQGNKFKEDQRSESPWGHFPSNQFVFRPHDRLTLHPTHTLTQPICCIVSSAALHTSNLQNSKAPWATDCWHPAALISLPQAEEPHWDQQWTKTWLYEFLHKVSGFVLPSLTEHVINRTVTAEEWSGLVGDEWTTLLTSKSRYFGVLLQVMHRVDVELVHRREILPRLRRCGAVPCAGAEEEQRDRADVAAQWGWAEAVASQYVRWVD